MNKSCLIDTFSHISRGRLARRGMLTSVLWIAVGSMLGGTQSPAFGQDDAKPAAKPAYPLAVATSGADIYTVDLDLPGVWKPVMRQACSREVPNCCEPMNWPRCVAIHPAGGILVGDTATREIYWIESADAEPKPLNNGYLGVVMALAVSPDGKTIYAGDAEKRATFKLPIERQA